MVLSTILPWSLLFVPFLTIDAAGRDAWLAAVPLTAYGLAVAWLVLALGRRFPRRSLVGILRAALGKNAGALVAGGYVLWFIWVGALTARGFIELINAMILPRTPMTVVLGSVLLVTATAVRSGIEVLVRTMQVVVPSLLAFLAVLVTLSVRDMDGYTLLPVLEHGALGPLRAAWVGAGFFGEAILGLAVVWPLLNRPEQARRAFVDPVWVAGILAMGSSMWYVTVLGPEVAGRLAFPPLEIARFISIAGFLERLEALAVAFWVFANFAKLGVWYYSATANLAELLGLADIRPLSWPVGLLTGELCLLMFGTQVDYFDFVRFSATPLMAIFQLAIPLLVWAVISVRPSPSAPAA